MMKKAAIILSAIILLTVSTAADTLHPADGTAPQISYENYPRIDGSLACVPLCEAVASRVTGCSAAQAEETLNDFLNTNPSYLALAKGERDLILAYEPAQETKEQLKEYEPLQMDPVGKDALVFIVNKDNPVKSLSQEDLFGIFTGKITNWQEVGGNNIPIKAFRRPETSGSQTLLRVLLLGDAPMVEETMELVSSMEGIISQVVTYENTSNAIGYSVYYYASSMYEQPGLRFLEVDGVAPSNDTIRSGEYPLVHDFYCVTNERSSEEALAIRDWLVSRDGQAFVESCGYVSCGSAE